jgi:hypothetical protein
MTDTVLDNQPAKPKVLTDARLFELHEKAKDARHNSGTVTLTVDELLEILPPKPVIVAHPAGETAVGDNHQPLAFQPADTSKPVAVAPVVPVA